MSLHLICHRTDVQYMCDKNISNKKHEKLRNYLSKMKDLNQSILGKGSSFQ